MIKAQRYRALSTLNLVILFFAATPPFAGAATFIVNSTVDAIDGSPGDGVCETAAGGGECTVRAALGEAQALVGAPHVINVPAGSYVLTLANDLDFHDDIHLLGAGSGATILDAAGGSSVVRIHADSDEARLSGVTLAGGAPYGIFNQSAGGALLELTDVSIEGATEGGVYSTADGVTLLTDSFVIGNASSLEGAGIRAPDGSARSVLLRTTVSGNVASSFAGGIYSEGELVLEDSVVSSNEAVTSSGGGIWNGGILHVIGGSISDNTAGTKGGGIYNAGPALLQGCLLEDNQAGSVGGAVANESTQLEIRGCELSSNNMASSGGAISNAGLLGSSSVRIFDSRIGGNVATAQGGGLYNNGGAFAVEMQIVRSTVDGNSADHGAGLYVVGGSVELLNATLSANSAVSSGGGVGAVSTSAVSIWYSTLYQNTAPSGSAIANSASVELYASIVAGDPTGNCAFMAVTSLGFNIEDGTICGFTQPGDMQKDPLLGALSSRGGGGIPVHLPSRLSPVIDGAAVAAACPGPSGTTVNSDAGSHARPVDGDGDRVVACDIGAVETESSGLLPIFAGDFETGTLLGWSL